MRLPLWLKPQFVISFVIGASIFAYMIWFVSPGELYKIFSKSDYRLFLMAWMMSLMATLFRTLRYSLFKQGSHSFFKSYSVFSLARFLNMALPFRMGDAAMLALLKKSGLSPTIAETLPIWLVLRLTDLLALAAWFSLFVGLSTVGRQYLPFGIAALVISLCGLFFIRFMPHLLSSAAAYASNNWLLSRLSAVTDGLSYARGTWRKVAASVFGLLIWAALIMSSLLLQFAFSTPLGIADAALATVLVVGFGALPVHAPLGIGTGELLWTGAMVLVGLTVAQAVPIALSVRLSGIIILLIDGAIGAAMLSHFKAVEKSKVTPITID